MSGYTLCDHTGKHVANLRTHRLPRIGEMVMCRGEAWRVFDIMHPSTEQEQGGIYQPYLTARRVDPLWLDKVPEVVERG